MDVQGPDARHRDPGHYCVAVFVHGGACLIGEKGTNVDVMVRTNRQIAQKNLHIGRAPGSPNSGRVNCSVPQR